MYPWEFVSMSKWIALYKNLETWETDVIDCYESDD